MGNKGTFKKMNLGQKKALIILCKEGLNFEQIKKFGDYSDKEIIKYLLCFGKKANANIKQVDNKSIKDVNNVKSKTNNKVR